MRILGPLDFLLFPLFALFFIFLLNRVRERYANTPLWEHFNRGLRLRLLGAFLSGLMYQYYYGYGDTFFYFTGASDILKGFMSDPMTGLEMIFKDYDTWSPQAKHHVTFHRFFMNDSEAAVIHIAGFFNLFSFGSYFGISLWLTMFSFVGCWLLFRVFYELYPHLHRQLAMAILYLPSLWFWGTGVMKDPLTLGGLGIFVYGMYHFFIQPRRILLSLIFIVAGGWLMANIKVYILVAILPASVVWIFAMYKNKIKNPTLRTLSTPVFLFGGIVGALLAFQVLGKYFQKYASLDKILHEAHKTQWWLEVSTERDGGTGYTLGQIDPTPTGLLKTFPLAVNVTLFRPYPWEARKPIVIPSAIEALFSFLFTLYVFFQTGLRHILPAIFKDPVVLFCLIFSLIFAFAVGFTSFNFGALARYRIPCLPFYFTMLVILLDKARQAKAARKVASNTGQVALTE